ncbi:MAG: hypothetical protein H6Q68_1642 [Firmicutes bacterium]|nr:hypothetical protein [Bacillota bacterium]
MAKSQEKNAMLTKRWRKLLMGILFLLTLLVTGCWDRKEIENRGYVLGLAIDHVVSPEPKGLYDLNETPQSAGQRKYKLTLEMPKFSKSSETKEVSKGQSHLIWSGEGESMFAINRMIATKTYFAPFFEDIQILIFSEAVAREGVGDIVDFFLRDAEMRRRVKIFVTPGRAEDILKAKLQVEEANSTFISKLTANTAKAPYFAGKAELAQFSQAIRSNRSFAVPIVVVEDKEVRLIKGAIFNKYCKMVGEIGELEILGGKILRKTLKEGIVVVPNPANPQHIATFEIYEKKIKVDSHIQDDQVLFTVEAVLIGNLGENMAHEQDAVDPVFTKTVEKAVAAEVTRSIKAAFSKQQQLKADVTDLGGLVHRQHPEYWKNVKDRWDEEVFPMAQLDVDIKISIRRPVITH